VNELKEKYGREIETILAKYPEEHKRAAVMPLLYLAQRERGFVGEEAIQEIADLLGISTTDVSSLVGFYTLYYDQPEGKFRVQVCTDLPCALRGADEFMEKLCEALEIEPGGTTADGLITVEPVMCLAACDRAPMFQLQRPEQIEYHENQTVESALELIDSLREGESLEERA
jgi:NADH-quinone oxidoreductase subunit E